MTTQTTVQGRIRNAARSIRMAWWLKCNRYALATRGEWARYEADWERDTRPGYPMSKADQQRRDFALAWADFIEAIGGERP